MGASEDKQEMQNAAEANPRPEAPQSEVQNSCHDIIFAILFLAAFAFTIVIAAMYGEEVMSDEKNLAHVENAIATWEVQHAKYKYAFKMSAYIALGCLGFSLFWTLVMLVCGKMLIWISVLIMCGLSVGAGMLSSKFLKDQGNDTYWWPAAVGAVVAALALLYVCCIRSRIAFASANLQVACRSVLNYPVILIIAIFFTGLQIGWALIWSLGTYAAINHGKYTGHDGHDDFGKGKKFGIFVGMLLIFFWASCVMRNIVMVTTAGTVSSWWHHSNQDRRPMTTMRSLCRALTLSFGSICFGSLIVSIIQTIRAILTGIQHQLSKSGNAVAACLLGCINCIVLCIEKWVEYFTRFAYAYVGIYGYSFVSSGKRVIRLFQAKGWSAIANDSLIANVLMLGKVVVGFGGAAAGWGVVAEGDQTKFAGLYYPEATMGITGFLIGYSVADVIMTVIDGAVATVFILFAEDPHSLRSTHPNSHETLHSTWKEIYPEEFDTAVKQTSSGSNAV